MYMYISMYVAHYKYSLLSLLLSLQLVVSSLLHRSMPVDIGMSGRDGERERKR